MPILRKINQLVNTVKNPEKKPPTPGLELATSIERMVQKPHGHGGANAVGYTRVTSLNAA
jgi:hypothetical protein